VRVLIDLVLSAGAVLLLIPATILALETVVALLPKAEDGPPPPVTSCRVVVLVPAHNEEMQIEATVRALAAQLPVGGRLVVIADNCTDRTAELAARAGATVVERRDPERVGKGFAISFGLRSLDEDPFDVVILVDADCRVSDGGLGVLAALAQRTGRPVQAEYLLSAPPSSSPTAVVSALAILLRNRVRPRGLDRLGFPCHLTGSGMAFPWQVLREAPETGSNLVEDLVMGIELALKGTPGRLCPSVQISSELPAGATAGFGQRKRWEHGQLHTLRSYAPRLIGAGLTRPSLGLLALGLDLAVPPLALLVLAQLGLFALTALAAGVGIASLLPLSLAAAAMVLVAVAVAAAWIGFGRRTIPFRSVLFVPAYLLWKIPLYAGLIWRGRQKTWERTEREPGAGGARAGAAADAAAAGERRGEPDPSAPAP